MIDRICSNTHPFNEMQRRFDAIKPGELFRKTMPFCLARLMLGGAMVLIFVILLAILMGIGLLFGDGGMLVCLLIWLGSIGVIRFVIMHYFGYLVKAGHVAVLALAVTTGVVPDHQVRFGKPDMLQIIADEYSAFLAAYQDNHSLMRLRYHRMHEAGERLEEMFTQRREYASSLEEVTEMGRFITEDEISELLVRANMYSGWKERVQQFFLEPYTPQEKISLLKEG